MPDCFHLSLAGIPISLIPDELSGGFDYIHRAGNFHRQFSPEITLQVHCGWFPNLNLSPVLFETDKGWRLLQVDGRWAIRVHSATQDPFQIGIFTADFRSGDIYVASSEATPGNFIFPLSYPMGELYMISLLGTGLGMLFHGAGVIDQGKGYLFAGQGTAGKTTIARLWQGLPGVQVVNDDKVIIRKEARGFRLYGTPWHGEGGMALPDSAPLRQVFILKQASQNYVKSLPPAQAASSLLTRSFIPLWDAGKMAFTLGFLDELCQSIPCLELGFLPDSSIVDFLRNLP